MNISYQHVRIFICWYDSYGGYLCKKTNKILYIKDGIVEKFFKGWDNTDSDMISIRGWCELPMI